MDVVAAGLAWKWLLGAQRHRQHGCSGKITGARARCTRRDNSASVHGRSGAALRKRCEVDGLGVRIGCLWAGQVGMCMSGRRSRHARMVFMEVSDKDVGGPGVEDM